MERNYNFKWKYLIPAIGIAKNTLETPYTKDSNFSELKDVLHSYSFSIYNVFIAGSLGILIGKGLENLVK